MRARVVFALMLGSLFLASVFLGVSFADLNDGLIAYYPLDGNANDESGNGQNGVVYGATLTADRFGNPNSAYYFGDTNDIIVVPANPILEPESEITLSAWIKPTDQALNRCSRIVRNAADMAPGYYLSWSQNNGMLELRLDGTNWVHLGTPNSKLIGAWHHVAVTYSTLTKVGNVFVDGQLIATSSDLDYAFQYSGSNLTIGNSPVMNENFPGSIVSVL